LHLYGQIKEGTGDKGKLLLAEIKFVFFAFLIPTTATFLWTSFADYQKSLNPLADFLTSASLRTWNFGTLADKFSMETWHLFYRRTITDLIGSKELLLVVFCCSFLCNSKYFKIASVSLLLFLMPLCIFTNLYIVHHYYAYANGIFLIAAVGIVIVNLVDSDISIKRIAGFILLVTMIVYTIGHYYTYFRPGQCVTFRYAELKKDIDAHTSDTDVLLIFGADWSPAMPYYLQRRAAMMRDASRDTPKYTNFQNKLSNYKIGALIFCGKEKYSKIEMGTFLQDFNIINYLQKNYANCSVYYNQDANFFRGSGM